MRELKFRAWDAKGKNLCKVLMLWPGDKGHGVQMLLPNGNIMLSTTASVEGVEVMQFTGLKDKNGVEIFECDILKYPDIRKVRHYNIMNIRPTDKEKEDMYFYSAYGFNTLIIWESELKNVSQVIQKIKEFDKK